MIGLNPLPSFEGEWDDMENIVLFSAGLMKKFVRRISDLTAWTVPICGHPAFLVELPQPAKMPHAYFSGMVLLGDAQRLDIASHPLRTRAETFDEQFVFNEMMYFSNLPARYFTAEMPAPEISQERRIAILCECTAEGIHRNLALPLSPDRADFISAIERVLTEGARRSEGK